MPSPAAVTGVIPPTPYIRDGHTPRHLYCTEDGHRVIYGAFSGVCLRPCPGTYEKPGVGGIAAAAEMYLTGVSEEKSALPLMITVASRSVDGRLLAAGDTNGTLHLWNQNRDGVSVKQWSLETYLTGGNGGGGITDIAFNDDARRIVVVGYSGGVVVRADNGTVFGVLERTESTGPFSAVAFRQKKPYVIVAARMGPKGALSFYECETELRCAYRAELRAPMYCVRFSPDGEQLASCGGDGKVNGWCILTGERDRSISVSSEALLSLAWARDSKRLVVVGVDYMMRIIDFSSGQILESIIAGQETPLSPVGVCWSTSDWLITLCSDGRFWGFKTDQQSQILPEQQFVWGGAQGSVTSISRPSVTGSVVAAADCRGTLVFLSTDSGEPRTTTVKQLGVPISILSVAVGKTLGVFVTEEGSASRTSDAWNENKPFRVPQADCTAIRTVHGVAEGRLAVATGGPLVVNAARTTFLSSVWPLKAALVDVLLLDGERVCAVFCRNGQIVVLPFQGALNKFSPLYTIKINGTIVAASATPDGGLLAVAVIPNDLYPEERLKTGRGGSAKSACIIELYEIDDATTSEGIQFVCVYDCHQFEITAVALNGLGTLVASADTDKNIHVVEIEQGKQKIGKEWKLHTDKITSLSWNPAGSLLASGSLDGKLVIWDVASSSPHAVVPMAQTSGITSVSFLSDVMVLCGGNDASLLTVTLKQET